MFYHQEETDVVLSLMSCPSQCRLGRLEYLQRGAITPPMRRSSVGDERLPGPSFKSPKIQFHQSVTIPSSFHEQRVRPRNPHLERSQTFPITMNGDPTRSVVMSINTDVCAFRPPSHQCLHGAQSVIITEFGILKLILLSLDI